MKQNRLMKWIVGLLTMLPFLAIAVTCAYVTFNKNAKDSYYGENINQVTYTPLTNENEIKVNERYNLNIPQNVVSNSNASGTFYISNVKNLNTNYSSSINANEITGFYIAYNGSLNANVFTIYRTTNQTIYINLNQYYITMDFNLDSYNVLSQWDYYYSYLNTISYNNYSYLDNAFYYAIDQFNGMGFDKIDFVSWFDVFNSTPSIYTTFINCYANYMLFVACITFLPRILYWFINFAFRVIDRFANYGGRW